MSLSSELSVIVVSCAGGVAPYLAEEIRALGFPVTWRGETAVETEGSIEDTMRLNLHLRTGHRIFYMIGEFPAYDPDELYERLVCLPWERYLPPDGYFTVDTAVDTPTIRNTQYAALKVKDAVADRMRERCGRRPDSGKDPDGVALFLHWTRSDAAIYLNTTGSALSRRGYRTQHTTAPMRESLAAAVVLASGWDGQGHFLNPMCGSGTLAIEAAWIGLNRAPGLLRSDYAFMHLEGFERSVWRALRQQAIAAIRPSLPGRIIASDVDAAAVRAAQVHAAEAGVGSQLEFDVCDQSFSPVPETALPGSVILLHPPYGARMGDSTTLRVTYADAGAFLRKHSPAYRGYLFTANPDLAARVGLQASRAVPFFNGPLECRLLEYGGYDPARRNHASGFSDSGAVSGS